MVYKTSTKFLITGAGGRTGATGNHAVRQLLVRQLPVRAFVFHADQRSEQLAELGAEVVVGDLRDIESVRRAMLRVTRAYFVYPIAEGLLEATGVFAVISTESPSGGSWQNNSAETVGKLLLGLIVVAAHLQQPTHGFKTIAGGPLSSDNIPRVLRSNRNRGILRQGCRMGRFPPVIIVDVDSWESLWRRTSMQFALLIYHAPQEFAMRENEYNHPHLAAWRAYYKALVEAGVYVTGNALEVPETGTTVRLREGKRSVQDGPYAETKEQLGGFIILELPSIDAALEWAARCPGAAIGTVEVRPLSPETLRRGFTG